ncbi:MAG: pyridoxal phosphate-dependent aminotransferase [Promethearchaeota archaeon]|nr:MAG: pyridoxal phosphate-dependent aminotransferase [Candidatus Lokiarchaeota archaeon]
MYSKRIDAIKPFIVMEVLEKALEMEERGIEVVHMEIGEPDFDTPARIIDGCMSDIEKGKTHYTHSLGYLELREALSEYKWRTRGTRFNPKTQFMVTGGTSPAFFNVLSSLLDPGDEVLITDPGYPCYANFVSFFGGKPVYLKIYEKNEFNVDIAEIKRAITSKTKALIINSPSNPTGQIIPRETLDELAELMEKHKFWVISDEIYSELTYDIKRAPSLSDAAYKHCHDRLVVLDGLSKFWAMTGWRLGYIIAPAILIEKMTPVQQNFSICAPSVSQAAAIHALNCEQETQEMLALYRKRRDYIVKRLNDIKGISCLTPKGAFYAFANIKDLGIDHSMQFAMEVLEKANVAICPGISFGPNGEGFVRFSYPTAMEHIATGMDRLKKYVEDTY